MSFNAERLRAARIYRNMSISDLAEKTDVTKQAISQYEKGQSNPIPDVMFQLVLALGFPKEFFEQTSISNIKISNTFFRALSSTNKLDLNTQEVKTEMIVQIYNFLSQYLTFPQNDDIPTVDKDTFDNIEQIAEYVRSCWALGDKPIENMVSLLESKGIIVSSFVVENKKIDAFTQIHLNGEIEQFCVVLGNDKQSMVRRNFDAAHELGHIILHRNIGDLSNLSKIEMKRLEDEANAFAAGFLLPSKSFFADLVSPNKLDFYISLKKKWKVSIAAMIMRSKQLGRLNNNQYLYLFKQLSSNQWRTREPYDDIWEIPRPQLFKKAISILIENKILNAQQIVSELSKNGLALDSREIENLLDLDKGVLSNKNQSQPAIVLSIK